MDVVDQQYYVDKDQNILKIIDYIFDTIIAITMFLCFFALSANMGANLYD